MFRALVLDERGRHAEAAELARSAERELYDPAYLDCRERLVAAAVQELERGDGPVVDLASGRGTLLERLARELDRPLVATDVSPTVLRRTRARLRALGLEAGVSFVCLDARRLPFATGAIETATTFLGLGNVTEPGDLLAELRRAVAGVFAPVCTFFPDGDEPNSAAAREAGLKRLLFPRSAEEAFAEAGWRVETLAECGSRALPTPPSKLFDGARVDALPVAESVAEWRLLRLS